MIDQNVIICIITITDPGITELIQLIRVLGLIRIIIINSCTGLIQKRSLHRIDVISIEYVT